ncbi:hypothetical protein [Tannockella kyphosi]|uniref:hypothetical protein n=1 Tax=Tannockella kyphosi TaxID=2899121 RepID=UPI002010C9A3|nr:hypothetical protein [Tannockella kyphosi]
MKRFEKVFYLVEVLIIVIFILTCHFISQIEFNSNGIIVLLLSLLLTVLACALNVAVLILQKEKNKSE